MIWTCFSFIIQLWCFIAWIGAVTASSSDSQQQTVSSTSSSSSSSSTKSIVSISYDQLMMHSSDDVPSSDTTLIYETIQNAFGPHGLGFLEVTGVPPRMVEWRRVLLRSLAPRLAQLPEKELEKITLPQMDYTIGWSHGKEQFGIDVDTGNPVYDTRKGSFYLDPFRPHLNIFPPTSLVPDLESILMEVTHTMTDITLQVSKWIDVYLRHVSGSKEEEEEPKGLVYTSLKSKINTKARLLFYFPRTDIDTSSEKGDDWCGWHKDHGSLTALLPGMLLSPPSSEPSNVKPHDCHLQDPSLSQAGLYIQVRKGDASSQPAIPIRVSLPPTSIGIQLGETVEIMSGGRLVATSHAVKKETGGDPRTARASLAVFLQPVPDQMLPKCPATADESLQRRYRPTFGAFQKATTKAFQ